MLDIRKKALALLAERWGGSTHLAKRLRVTPSYVSQMLSGTRPITEKTAQSIEEKLGLAVGWMSATPAARPPDTALMTRAIEKVYAIAEAKGVRLAPAKFAELAILVYETAARNNVLDESYVTRMVNLTKP